jgi:hypothetical protein
LLWKALDDARVLAEVELAINAGMLQLTPEIQALQQTLMNEMTQIQDAVLPHLSPEELANLQLWTQRIWIDAQNKIAQQLAQNPPPNYSEQQ